MQDKCIQLPLFSEPVIHATTGKPRRIQAYTCERCGTVFHRYPADVRKAAKRGGRMRYCSKACEFATRSVANLQRVCAGCGTGFTVWPSAIRHAAKSGWVAGRFCSARCAARVQGEERKTGSFVPCAACGAPVWRTTATLNGRNFCSYRCMGTQVHSWCHHGHGKMGARADLGHFVRSRWEANVCRVLIAIGTTYEYEPQTFRMGDVSYTPDLLVPAWNAWVEVKGWLTPVAEAKIAAFRATYPNERLVVIDRRTYDAIAREWRDRIPAWEA